jgi:hypothetical protein
VARFDKYEPHVGGFRARLAANWLLADVAVLIAVGLDANGRVVKGAGNAGCLGVVALGKVRQAGDQIDTMTFGEIVDCAGLTAGTDYYVSAAGAITDVPMATGVNRLVVRWQRFQG